jgi:hypothetical protein
VSHMVIYRGSDGKPGYHQVDDIHDAVSYVEEMRNTEGVDHARIFRLEEINFEFKPYYRVEIGGVAAASLDGDDDVTEADDSDSVVAIAESSSDAEEVDESSNGNSDEDITDVESEDADDEAAGGGARRGLFGR